MSKSSFLTYRQDLTLSVPGSSRATFPGVLPAQPRPIDQITGEIAQFAGAAEFAFREFVLSNFTMALFVVYSVAAEIRPLLWIEEVLGKFSIGATSKRSIDIIASTVGLIILLPLFTLLAIAIKLDSDGPVFFSQSRVGRNRRRSARRAGTQMCFDRRERDRRRDDVHGQPFKVWKFRSMVNNAEKKSGPIWATENDPRITRVGSFLRRTRLDEFPQLFNVLKGEMSLVGPRPERPVFVESLRHEVKDYTKRLEAKPGITGLAQVTCGYDTSVSSVRAKVDHDLRYITSWSLTQDVKILMKTVVVMLTGKGAF
ncbi:MAG: sugar transferase [Candidatus Zixiibacteriota bacterium]